MLLLAIETSCDDTAAAWLEVKAGKFIVRKNLVASQAKLHAKYQGVVPEVAARAHLETMIPVLQEVVGSPSFTKEGVGGWSKPDAIVVTAGPGLITSLLVGVETAKALAFAWNVPLIKINHIEGHILSPLLSNPHSTLSLKGRGDICFPAMALVVSGGHTELILIKNHGQYKLLGRTRDDAAGECFDKAAKMLGLPYPGGPAISKRAAKGNPLAFALPRPMLYEPGFEFSFSGMKNAIRLLIEELKTNVILEGAPHLAGRTDRIHLKNTGFLTASPQDRLYRSANAPLQDDTLNDLCASIEHAIVDVLVQKSIKAVAKHKPKTFILAGGVAANKKLRESLKNALPKSTRFLLPEQEYCMDNAAMIAVAGYFQAKKKKFVKYDKLKAEANWELV